MFVFKKKYKNSINLSWKLACASAFLIAKTLKANAFSIHFDYSYDSDVDTGNYFFSDDPDVSGDEGELYGDLRKSALEEAANYYETYISDSLDAITDNTSSETGIGYDWGGVVNTWAAIFSDPATGNNQSITDFTLAVDTITIFAGGRSLSGSTLGEGGTGGLSYSIITDEDSNVLNQDFIDLVIARGEVGALAINPTDIGLWGGSITFDNDGDLDGTAYIWNNEINSTPTIGEVDFLSVAIHELGHVLGFGGSSWQTNVDFGNGLFTGSNAVNSYGSNVPLSDTAHWMEGLTSTAIDGTPNQEVALDPSLDSNNNVGERKLLTELDYSGLADIGWEVSSDALNIQPVPFEFSPSFGILLMCGFLGTLKAHNFWKNRK